MKNCQKGTTTKIDHSDASTLFQAAKLMDADRKLEPSWGKALESIERSSRSKMIEIFVNADKQKIIDDAKAKWENVHTTNHATDPESDLFALFALRTYLEHSCEQDKPRGLSRHP